MTGLVLVETLGINSWHMHGARSAPKLRLSDMETHLSGALLTNGCSCESPSWSSTVPDCDLEWSLNSVAIEMVPMIKEIWQILYRGHGDMRCNSLLSLKAGRWSSPFERLLGLHWKGVL